MRSCRHTDGATLVEIVVVVGMVALLAGLLFPVIVSAHRRAVDTKCISHLKAVYAALTAYMADYDRHFPIISYWYPDRDDPEYVRWATEIARKHGWPTARLGPEAYKPPWPPPPPPPSWYTLRVAMRDYVEDESIWFCPERPKQWGYPGPEDMHSEMGYTQNDTLAGAAIDELTWPLHEVPVLFDISTRANRNKPGHLGTGFNELRLDGAVAKVRSPLQSVCVRLPWDWVKHRVAVMRGEIGAAK